MRSTRIRRTTFAVAIVLVGGASIHMHVQLLQARADGKTVAPHTEKIVILFFKL